jgi:hypothetical protein
MRSMLYKHTESRLDVVYVYLYCAHRVSPLDVEGEDGPQHQDNNSSGGDVVEPEDALHKHSLIPPVPVVGGVFWFVAVLHGNLLCILYRSVFFCIRCIYYTPASLYVFVFPPIGGYKIQILIQTF